MDRIEILEHLAEVYKTDKLEHGYLPFYDRHLPKDPKSLLEIGCLEGASLRMWRDVFSNADLGTLDLFKYNTVPNDIRGLTCYTGSQNDGQIMQSIRARHYEIIIDDGSHNSRDQWASLHFLAQPNTLYIIEDLHCCKEEFYREGLPFDLTVLGMIKKGNFPYKHYLYSDKIVFIEL